MQAPHALDEPGPEHRLSTPFPTDDPEVPPWRAAYVMCPACHRPVRRERLSTHMELLHADAEATPVEAPASAPVSPPAETPAKPARAGVLRAWLARILRRRH